MIIELNSFFLDYQFLIIILTIISAYDLVGFNIIFNHFLKFFINHRFFKNCYLHPLKVYHLFFYYLINLSQVIKSFYLNFIYLKLFIIVNLISFSFIMLNFEFLVIVI